MGNLDQIKFKDKKTIALEYAKNLAERSTPEEIANFNDEFPMSDTPYIDIGINALADRLEGEELEKFRAAIAKYPLVDLACGNRSYGSNYLFDYIFKDTFIDRVKKEMMTRPIPQDEADFVKKIENFNLPEPKQYIGVDKYVTQNPTDEAYTYIGLQHKLQFEKKDMIEFLKTLPDSSVNIFIGGFNDEVSNPKGQSFFEPLSKPDYYRIILMYEIQRVLADDGYLFESTTQFTAPLPQEAGGGKLRLEDFGIMESEFSGDGIIYNSLCKKGSAPVLNKETL